MSGYWPLIEKGKQTFNFQASVTCLNCSISFIFIYFSSLTFWMVSRLLLQGEILFWVALSLQAKRLKSCICILIIAEGKHKTYQSNFQCARLLESENRKFTSKRLRVLLKGRKIHWFSTELPTNSFSFVNISLGEVDNDVISHQI